MNKNKTCTTFKAPHRFSQILRIFGSKYSSQMHLRRRRFSTRFDTSNKRYDTTCASVLLVSIPNKLKGMSYNEYPSIKASLLLSVNFTLYVPCPPITANESKLEE